jgi:hypothetical protein
MATTCTRDKCGAALRGVPGPGLSRVMVMGKQGKAPPRLVVRSKQLQCPSPSHERTQCSKS